MDVLMMNSNTIANYDCTEPSQVCVGENANKLRLQLLGENAS